MTVYEAAVDLIREADLCRVLAEVGRDTNTDHLALYEARRRFEEARRA